MKHVLAVLALASLFPGCSDSVPPPPELPDLFPVSGTVTMNGEPLDGAAVMFLPGNAGGVGAVGVTGADGVYELTTRDGAEVKPGAAAGSYKVVISRYVQPDGTPVPPDPSQPPAMLGGIESVPDPYSSAALTTLTAEVSSGGGDDFDFNVE